MSLQVGEVEYGGVERAMFRCEMTGVGMLEVEKEEIRAALEWRRFEEMKHCSDRGGSGEMWGVYADGM